MLNGELYIAADPELVKDRENARRLTRYTIRQRKPMSVKELNF